MSVRTIAPGLYQGSLYDAVQEWKTLEPKIDVALVMTHESGEVRIPRLRVTVIPFVIADAQMGLDSWTFDKLSQTCRKIAKQNVLTACYKGENRAGLASALILIHRGMSPEAAIKLVQSNGPISTPGHATALWNPGFRRQLLELRVA